MPNGGTLTIITSLSKDKRSYQIEITDTGCGIAPEDLKQIFDNLSESSKITLKEYGFLK
jgi:signal transduction histidine kinase